MPKNYAAGFTVASYDFNGDQTTDYILLTKAGTPRLFFVDGRTGQVTAIAGKASPNLRSGMAVQQADLTGGTASQFVLSPSRNRSGKITAVDLQSQGVLWTSSSTVAGGMKVNFASSFEPGRATESDVTLSRISTPRKVKILDGQTGKVESSDQVRAARFDASKTAATGPSHHRRSPMTSRTVKFKRGFLPR